MTISTASGCWKQGLSVANSDLGLVNACGVFVLVTWAKSSGAQQNS